MTPGIFERMAEIVNGAYTLTRHRLIAAVNVPLGVYFLAIKAS